MPLTLAFKSFTDEINSMAQPYSIKIYRVGYGFTIQWYSPDEPTLPLAYDLGRGQAHIWLEGFLKGLRIGQGKPPVAPINK